MLTPPRRLLLCAPHTEAAPRPRVAGLQVSASDAISEDVCRTLAKRLAAAQPRGAAPR